MKNIEISKELLIEVFKDEIERLIDSDFTYGVEDNYILFAEGGCVIFEKNLYEVADKIEDWIEFKGIPIIRIKEGDVYEFYINAYIDGVNNELLYEYSISSESRIQGIISTADSVKKYY